MNSRECAHIGDKSRWLDADDVIVPITEFEIFRHEFVQQSLRSPIRRLKAVISVARAVEPFDSNEDQSRRSIRLNQFPSCFAFIGDVRSRFPIKNEWNSVLRSKWMKGLAREWMKFWNYILFEFERIFEKNEVSSLVGRVKICLN